MTVRTQFDGFRPAMVGARFYLSLIESVEVFFVFTIWLQDSGYFKFMKGAQ